MHLLRAIIIGLGVAGCILATLAVLMFNRPALGWQALSVPTGSMRPTMSPGSLVLIHRVPISTLKVGDVITHTNPLTMRSTLTHRIIKAYKMNGKIPAFITKGDANPSPDPPIVGGLVQGKMIWHVPYVGRVLMWAKTWTGIAVFVYLPALLIMIHETRCLAAYLRKMKPYQLEGWVRLRSDEPMPNIQPKWAMAAGATFLLMIVVAGWQMAEALGGPAPQTLLVLTPNVITASGPPSSPAQVSSSSTATSNSAGTDLNANMDTKPSYINDGANKPAADNVSKRGSDEPVSGTSNTNVNDSAHL